FFVMNLSAAHTIRLKGSMSLELAAYVNNLLNRMYYAYGWRWESYNESSGDLSYGIGVYPQAPRNFSIKASLYF
ncbi:MAG: TonB-dependent receptor, partial [Bacteroidales bacterium]|nr:TonB-dependent receptor [Bacteroidales bacterium]